MATWYALSSIALVGQSIKWIMDTGATNHMICDKKNIILQMLGMYRLIYSCQLVIISLQHKVEMYNLILILFCIMCCMFLDLLLI